MNQIHSLFIALISILCFVPSCTQKANPTYIYSQTGTRKDDLFFGASPTADLNNTQTADLFQEATPGDSFAKAELTAIPIFYNREVPKYLEFGAGPGSSQWTPPEWRHAKSLLKLREKINTLAPMRLRGHDGFIGNCAHCCKSLQKSDHCPWVKDDVGIVTAYDITHCPKEGLDCNILVDQLVKSRDPRIKYIIWNKRIINRDPVNGVAAWTWRKYGGSNGHTKHCHISILPNKALYDSTNSWNITALK